MRMDLDWVSCVGGRWVICLIDFRVWVSLSVLLIFLWDSEMSKLLWNGNACPSSGLIGLSV